MPPKVTHIMFFCCGMHGEPGKPPVGFASYVPATQEFDSKAACENALQKMKEVNQHFTGTCVPKDL